MHITEYSRCRTQFRDGPEVAGVCPKCGHENSFATDDEYGDDYLRTVMI